MFALRSYLEYYANIRWVSARDGLQVNKAWPWRWELARSWTELSTLPHAVHPPLVEPATPYHIPYHTGNSLCNTLLTFPHISTSWLAVSFHFFFRSSTLQGPIM
uniref:Uncharacterized protein n=1 Tax=Eutreptiella gymnastica TaxID=73025 RepID=A0A7S4G829_9EUGL